MKTLMPIDGSECSFETLKWASRFLTGSKHKIHILHVIYYSEDALVHQSETDEAQRILHEAKTFLEGKGFEVEAAESVLGAPSEAICKYADENGIEQIVIGSHGRQGLARFLMGSVSEAVFKQAKQPVLVVNNSQQSSLSLSHPDKVSFTQGA